MSFSAVVVRLRPHWLEPAAATVLQATLHDRVAWRQERLRLYGREVEVPRLVAWFGDPRINYRYSGTDHPCTGWLPVLDRLRARLFAEEGLRCNLVLLNRYRNGRDYMGWHCDDERGHAPLIASVSLGATRRLLLRPAAGDAGAAGTGGRRRSAPLELTHGSLLLMDGRVPHTLPSTRRLVGERINLTFRCIAAAAPCATP
jgi:alkylated DNA repair dioxygenase AlkB